MKKSLLEKRNWGRCCQCVSPHFPFTLVKSWALPSPKLPDPKANSSCTVDSLLGNYKISGPIFTRMQPKYINSSTSFCFHFGTSKDGAQQGHSSVSSYNGSSFNGEWGVPTFQHQQTISMEWTPEEQSMLEEGLATFASEANIIRYAKIAFQIKTKTVRDVALRCRWMTKKEITKRRKDDSSLRKNKERKEKGVIDSSIKPSRFSIKTNLSRMSGMVSTGSDDGILYSDVSGVIRKLLQQNAWAFKQISSNIATHQIRENVSLLSQARDNIYKILNNLDDMVPTMKKMPPLLKVNEELAMSILPPPTFAIH